MNETLIKNHNEVVQEDDVVFHVGDFCFGSSLEIKPRLNGLNYFLGGDHDSDERDKSILKEIKIEDKSIVMCHWAMRVWPKSHYGSWNLHGHSHGKLPDLGLLQYDVGVDNNDFKPVSFEKLKKIFKQKEKETFIMSEKEKQNTWEDFDEFYR
jgi:calcineurin-like phosphoesterase family protein